VARGRVAAIVDIDGTLVDATSPSRTSSTMRIGQAVCSA
jgi:beta-phosphoglucomutase-like phosphatase (HAD superfamily)